MNHRRNAMNIGKDEPFKSEMGMRPLKASEVLLSTFSIMFSSPDTIVEVAEAVERLVVSGESGQVLICDEAVDPVLI